MTVDDLEALLKKHFKRQHKINFARYANDFIITGATKELLEYEVKPLVIKFLATRGLELSEKKTKIAHINNGFDVPGFNIRKYNGKLLTKSATSTIKELLD